MKPAFTVVVSTRDQRRHLERLLTALVGLERPAGDVELIVVDDGSSDETASLLESRRNDLPLRVLRLHGHAGRAACRQLGWRASSGEVVVFVDADMLIDRDWLLAYERALSTTRADLVSGARWWVDEREVGASTTAAQISHQAHAGANPGPVFGALEAELALACAVDPQPMLVAFAAQASNFAVRRAALAMTSGFNTCLGRFDDVELGMRLWQAGARFTGAVDARAIRVVDTTAPEAAVGWMDDEDVQAIFWRHPFRDLYRVHQWARRRLAGGPGADAQLAPWLEAPCDVEQLRLEMGACGPGPQTWAEEDLAPQFARMYGLAPEDVASHLERWIVRGLYYEERDGRRHFQIDRLDDWLRDTTPLLLEPMYRKDLARALTTGRDAGTAGLISATATLDVSIDLDALAATGVDGINLPLPVDRSGQRAVRILSGSPPRLLEAAHKARGLIAGFSCADVPGGKLRLEYSFELPVPMSGSFDDSDPASYLACALPPDYRQRAEGLLKRLDLGDDPVDSARRILEWIEAEVLFGNMPPQHAYYRVLDYGAGICIQQTRVFVALCRIAGIPAREVCGAVLPWGDADAPEVTKEMRTRGHSPFSHTWGEFYSPERGWVPTEIRGFGHRGFTPVTVPDPVARSTIERTLYEFHPFGTLAPHRIIVGRQANRLTPLQLPIGLDPATARRALDSVSYLVTCVFRRADERAAAGSPSQHKAS